MQMYPNLIKRWDFLEYEWMNSWKVVSPYRCNYIHPHTSCTYEFIHRIFKVCRIGLKYYVFFHLIPLVLRLKKSKTHRDKGKAIFKTLYEYIRSVLFMGFLVAFTKGALCMKNKISYPFDGYFMSSQAVLAGSSIFWQQHGRQREIGYFIMAKALRSIYVMLKRIGIFNFSNEAISLHVIVMALLAYLFHHRPDILKYKETFELIWGKD